MTSTAREPEALARVGLVVHPVRNIEEPLEQVLAWAHGAGVEVGEIPFVGEGRLDLERIDPSRCDLVVAIGGDGTTLSAVRSAAAADRPVLGVAYGSLGALTTVKAEEIGSALERFAAGDWISRAIPALAVDTGEEGSLIAYNDLAVVRQGEGQVRVSAFVDDELYVRLAGDGVIVSTAAGSAAYTLAGRGPLLDPALDAFVLTPLPFHGGFSPPLVMRHSSKLELRVKAGYGGSRLELDGRIANGHGESLTITLTPEAAIVVAFAGQESHLTGLRRRGIITDSPRILADDRRAAS